MLGQHANRFLVRSHLHDALEGEFGAVCAGVAPAEVRASLLYFVFIGRVAKVRNVQETVEIGILLLPEDLLDDLDRESICVWEWPIARRDSF